MIIPSFLEDGIFVHSFVIKSSRSYIALINCYKYVTCTVKLNELDMIVWKLWCSVLSHICPFFCFKWDKILIKKLILAGTIQQV